MNSAQNLQIQQLKSELDRSDNDARKFSKAIDQIRREKQIGKDLKQENILLSNTLEIVEKTLNRLQSERLKTQKENDMLKKRLAAKDTDVDYEKY